MERIIDISVFDGKLWAEDEGYLGECSYCNNYLFSIAVPYGLQKKPCRIFSKGYPKTNKVFRGIYYITLTKEFSEQLPITEDYNFYTDGNIDGEVDGFFGQYVSQGYEQTITLDLDRMEAYARDETEHLQEIIKFNYREEMAHRQHDDSLRRW